MSAAVSMPEEALDAHTCFEISRTQVARCMQVIAALERDADAACEVLDRFADAYAELQRWTDLAEEAARVIAKRAA